MRMNLKRTRKQIVPQKKRAATPKNKPKPAGRDMSAIKDQKYKLYPPVALYTGESSKTYVIDSEPRRCRVYRDNELIGYTPISVLTDCSVETKLRLSMKGYRSEEISIKFPMPPAIMVTLQRYGSAEEKTGSE